MKRLISAILVVTLIAVVGIGCGEKENSAEEKGEVSVSETAIMPPSMGLHEAAIRGDLEAILQHIEAGSDLDEKESMGGASPVMTATTFGKTDVAMALIEAGIDLNFKKNDGSTPLHVAAFFCRSEIVQALLDKGADKSLRNNAGATPREAVTVPFEDVKGIYDYLGNILGPMGLKLDYEQIKTTRPMIAKMLK